MITVKVGDELQELLMLAYQANKPVMLLGPTGIGKSESIEEAAKRLGIDYLCRDLALMDGPDLTGIPRDKDGRTVYSVPSFLPKENTKGLLCFEELNRAPRYTRTPCLQLLTARRLNDYILPKGWLPVAAVNPGDDEYCDVEELDKALLARFMLVDVVPDVPSWLVWAQKNHVHPTVMAFVRSTPKIFDAPRSNPRAWKDVSDVIKVHEQKNIAPHLLFAAVNGFVGNELTQGFLSFCSKKDTLKVPSPEQILNSYSSVKADVQALGKSGDTASLDSLVNQVLMLLQNPADEQKVKASTAATRNLRSLMGDLPAEFAKKIRNRVKWIGSK